MTDLTMTNTSRFWDRIAPSYAAKPVPDEAVYARKLAVTRNFLHPEMRVLEVGCGTGSTALNHAPHAREIIATDISPGMIDIAKAKAEEAGVANVDCRVAALDEMDPAEARFDMVQAHSILHLVPNWTSAIAQLRRLLKPGGTLVLSVPCLGDLNPVLRGLLKLAAATLGRFGRFPTFGWFTAQQLEFALVEAGFSFDYHWEPNPGRDLFLIARREPLPR